MVKSEVYFITYEECYAVLGSGVRVREKEFLKKYMHINPYHYHFTQYLTNMIFTVRHV